VPECYDFSHANAQRPFAIFVFVINVGRDERLVLERFSGNNYGAGKHLESIEKLLIFGISVDSLRANATFSRAVILLNSPPTRVSIRRGQKCAASCVILTLCRRWYIRNWQGASNVLLTLLTESGCRRRGAKKGQRDQEVLLICGRFLSRSRRVRPRSRSHERISCNLFLPLATSAPRRHAS
jgi:hypothetical protein